MGSIHELIDDILNFHKFLKRQKNGGRFSDLKTKNRVEFGFTYTMKITWHFPIDFKWRKREKSHE